ncbi:hypothetical protein KSF73_01540 [Burkholderiaceae bacterium DAT-1]|nr:hypothetical protein [Burkholderiaceae bacterium DAT-1]
MLNIFQITIIDNKSTPQSYPQEITENFNSVKLHYPDANHVLLDTNDILAFLEQHFEAEVLDAFNLLAPYAYKADLARYCLLYIYGGLYIDVGIRLLNRLIIPIDKKFYLFRDLTHSSNTPWAVSNGIFFANAGCNELRIAIDLVLDNIRKRFYGPNSLHTTGPALFGRAFAIANDPNALACGEVRKLTADCHEINIGFVDACGRLIGLRNKPKTVQCLGIEGSNSYPELWHSKRIFGETTLAWQFSDPAIYCHPHLRDGSGISIINADIGCQVYGPYIALEDGRYTVTIHFQPESIQGYPYIDACSEKGFVTHAATSTDDPAPADGKIILNFDLQKSCRNFEIRIHSTPGFSGLFTGYTIQKN